jgi:hypothetical protein
VNAPPRETVEQMAITFHVAKWSHFHARCHANLIAPDATKLQTQLKFDQKEMKEIRKENYLYVSIKKN